MFYGEPENVVKYYVNDIYINIPHSSSMLTMARSVNTPSLVSKLILRKRWYAVEGSIEGVYFYRMVGFVYLFVIFVFVLNYLYVYFRLRHRYITLTINVLH